MTLPYRPFALGCFVLAAACGGKILVEASPDAGDVGNIDAGRKTVPIPTSTSVPDTGPPPEKPSLPDSAQLVELGMHSSGESFQFTVPPNTLGFTLVATGADDTAVVRIASLVTPSGEVLFTDGKPRGTDVPTGENFGFASAAVPQVPVYAKSPVEAGSWKVTFFSESPKPLRVTLAVQRTSDGFFHGGELDVHVYVPKGLQLSQPGPKHEVTIEDAPNDLALAARIDAFYELLERVTGIGRGKVRYHGMPAQYAAIDYTSDELYAAFRETSTTMDGQALHVVFTNDLGGALGVAPAIPGNPIETGTSLSAIAVTQFEGSSPGLDAFTMVHEMGHFGGLSHTTEFSDTFEQFDAGADAGPSTATFFSDPLPDTPACDGGVTFENLFSCPDVSNVMFPTGDQETGVLSASQVRVLRGSSIYRAKADGPIVAPPRLPLPKLAAIGALPPNMKRCVTIGRRARPTR